LLYLHLFLPFRYFLLISQGTRYHANQNNKAIKLTDDGDSRKPHGFATFGNSQQTRLTHFEELANLDLKSNANQLKLMESTDGRYLRCNLNVGCEI